MTANSLPALQFSRELSNNCAHNPANPSLHRFHKHRHFSHKPLFPLMALTTSVNLCQPLTGCKRPAHRHSVNLTTFNCMEL